MQLVEDTNDIFAQDAAGNVWYLGESVKNIKNGNVVSSSGSWQWGVDGALPGIVMWASPADHVGPDYQQEYYVGKAEDYGKVMAVNQSVTVPAGSFTGCIITDDWTPLEPKAAHDNKTYCPNVGEVRLITVGEVEKIELISLTP